ncbi:hypothetical protein J2X84_001991 [Pseudomonas corrugata]|uniref:hypothetical protein n=1 Tax=Pseudomonas corrugata TaxID=47879 RepID=UPI00285C38A0|nr:hypothetical protein [Pseudomonas corrugata]MDR7283167.1 hypothetical protein [Pseudomonas corrugata]
MKFFTKFFASIGAFFSGNVTEGVEHLLPRIDEEEIKKNLRILEKAHEHGARGIPAADDTQQTETEYQIHGTVGKMRAATVKYGEQRMKNIQYRLDNVQLSREANRVAQLGKEFVRESDKILSANDSKLKTLTQDLQVKKGLLDNFRSANKLPETEAKLPKHNEKSKRWALLIISCGAEALANAFLFANNMAGGLTSGLLLAVMLSVFNIAGCFIAGRFFTYSNHIKYLRSMFGWVSGALGLLYTLLFGLMVAYCRFGLGLIEDQSDDQVAVIMQNIKALVSPFVDFESIGLFGLTVFCGLLGLRHGYYWTDTYPGYGKVYGAYVEAYKRQDQMIRSLRKALEDEKSKKLEKIEGDVSKAEEAIRTFKRYMNEKSVVKKKVDEHLVKADNTIRSLIRCYRYENQLKRPVEIPRPAYFNDPVELDDQESPDYGTESDEVRLVEQEMLLSEMIAIIEPTRAKIEASFNQNYDQLKPLISQI